MHSHFCEGGSIGKENRVPVTHRAGVILENDPRLQAIYSKRNHQTTKTNPYEKTLEFIRHRPGGRPGVTSSRHNFGAKYRNGHGALVSNTSGTDNTADGYNALNENTTGSYNNAVGAYALMSNSSGSRNTADGEGALDSSNASDNTAFGYGSLYNALGAQNTAVGSYALAYNLSGTNNTGVGFSALDGDSSNGISGTDDTGIGASALFSLGAGSDNTGVGSSALYSIAKGSGNTANGADSLYDERNGGDNTATGLDAMAGFFSGSNNTATGALALYGNGSSSGSNNTADGFEALYVNTTGHDNAVLGYSAMVANTTGYSNTTLGDGALSKNTTGSTNIAIGYNSGLNLTTGSNNIDIAAAGAAGESKTIRIGAQGAQTKAFIQGIYNVTAASGVPVYVSSTGQLGTLTSSARFKKNIHDMGHASDALMALHPVTFQYKDDIDPNGTPQFGLIAEQVEKVDPDLVVHDENHQVYTVRYEAVNAMLLNEFQKDHATIDAQN